MEGLADGGVDAWAAAPGLLAMVVQLYKGLSMLEHPVVADVGQVDDSSDDRRCIKLNCVGSASWMRQRQLAYGDSSRVATVVGLA